MQPTKPAVKEEVKAHKDIEIIETTNQTDTDDLTSSNLEDDSESDTSVLIEQERYSKKVVRLPSQLEDNKAKITRQELRPDTVASYQIKESRPAKTDVKVAKEKPKSVLGSIKEFFAKITAKLLQPFRGKN